MNIAGDVLHHDEGCDRLTGSAGNGHMAAFGCVGGALVVEAHDGEYEECSYRLPPASPRTSGSPQCGDTPGLTISSRRDPR